jgi:hypothetical protein
MEKQMATVTRSIQLPSETVFIFCGSSFLEKKMEGTAGDLHSSNSPPQQRK